MRDAYIRQQAIKRGLDPNAVLAIAQHEGLSGGVGDGGHAFGPFQLNDAGGVLTNAPAAEHSNAWAWSNAGINFALDRIAQVAGGLKGRAAITAITQRFERPANPGAEIQDALAHYGGVSHGAQQSGQVFLNAGQKAGTTFDTGLFKQKAGLILLQQAADRAQGIQPQQDLLTQLDAARASATTRVSIGGGLQGGGMPVGGRGGVASKAVSIAAKQIGTPYVWGGESKAGFDCSGLVQYAYAKLGIKLPRTAAEQGQVGRSVNFNNLKPGDLLVENNGDHVVMYAGNGRVIQAPHTGENVQYSPLSWFPSSQYNARRIIG